MWQLGKKGKRAVTADTKSNIGEKLNLLKIRIHSRLQLHPPPPSHHRCEAHHARTLDLQGKKSPRKGKKAGGMSKTPFFLAPPLPQMVCGRCLFTYCVLHVVLFSMTGVPL